MKLRENDLRFVKCFVTKSQLELLGSYTKRVESRCDAVV